MEYDFEIDRTRTSDRLLYSRTHHGDKLEKRKT